MDKLFLQIINMTITSSYIILFIILIRFFLKKAPKIFSYLLWIIPFIRLIFPFSFESVLSLVSISKETIPESIVYSQTPQIQSGIMAIDRTVNRVLPAAEPSASVNPIQIWISIGSIVWIGGFILLLIYSIYSTAKLSGKLKSATLVKDNIYKKDSLDTAFVFGLIKPKIYLPDNLSKNEKSFIIKHEETHIKRFDHIVKFAAFIILSIHWFNPLVWIAFYLMGEDMELSCDESVIKEMGYEIKKDYSNSLLSLSSGSRVIGGSPIAFAENETKGRIKNILNYRAPKFWVTLLVVVVIVALSIGFLSDRPGLAQGPMDLEDEIYVNEKYGFTFELPNSWNENKDKIDIDDLEDGVSFSYIFEKDDEKNLQWIFSIVAMTQAEYEEALYDDMPMMGRYLAEKDGNVYLLYESIESIIIEQDQNKEFYERYFLTTEEILERFNLDNPDKIMSVIKPGLYVTSDGLSHIEIEQSRGFTLNRHMAMSYRPVGYYIVSGDKLLLYADHNEEVAIVEFIIDGDTLIFQAGGLLEDVNMEKGRKFIHSDLESDYNIASAEAEKIAFEQGYSVFLSEGEDILIGDSEIFQFIKEASIVAGYEEEDFNNMSGDRKIVSFQLLEKSIENETVALDIVVDRGKAIGAYLSYYWRNPGIEPINYKDFNEGSINNGEGDHLGYIKEMELDEDVFLLDPVEFLTREDKKRIEALELKIDNDFPSGFYIHNPEGNSMEFTLTNETGYMLLDWTGELNHLDVTKDDFVEYNNSLDYSPLYNIFMEDGSVTLIREQYIP